MERVVSTSTPSKCELEQNEEYHRERIGTGLTAVCDNKIVSKDNTLISRDSQMVCFETPSADPERMLGCGSPSFRSLGDEMRQLLSLVQTNDFVRAIVSTKGNVPSVILYTDRQIRELKSFCFDRRNGAVWGFGKTLNVTESFMTTTVYKNLALARNETRETPIFIGPLFLHGQPDIETYGQFVGHLSSQLADCDSQQLTIGSDNDSPMRKCFELFFPRSNAVVCSLNLKNNVRAQLNGMLRRTSKLKRRLVNALFGDDGLVACDDEASFDACVYRLRCGVLSEAPAAFKDYFNGVMCALMRANVVTGPGRSRWTNNNVKSINHQIKMATDRKLMALPQLIETLRQLIDGQYCDADRALCGLGNFHLRPEYAQHRCTGELWRRWTHDQRRKASANCFRLPKIVTPASTDSGSAIPGGSTQPQRVKRTRKVKRVRLTVDGDGGV